jgi:hypothetical protein
LGEAYFEEAAKLSHTFGSTGKGLFCTHKYSKSLFNKLDAAYTIVHNLILSAQTNNTPRMSKDGGDQRGGRRAEHFQDAPPPFGTLKYMMTYPVLTALYKVLTLRRLHVYGR